MEIDDFQELVRAFVVEADETILEVENALVTLEQEAADTAIGLGRLKALLRPLHTFKGNAGMLGLASIASLIHGIEELIKRDVTADATAVRDLFLVIDDLKRGLAEVREGTEDATDLSAALARVEALAAGSRSASQAGEAAPVGGDIAMNMQNDTLRVSSDKLDTLQRDVGELILSFNALEDLLKRGVLPQIQRQAARDLADAMQRLAARVRTVQAQTTQIRLLSLQAILRRVPRIARDAAERTGKKVRVIVDGENTEADKAVVEQLADVIVHLVRNAVDHGIEAPPGRRAVGKDETGLLMVRANNRGDHITIEIEDDGAGIDLQRVRAKAIERGLVAAEEAKHADDEVVLRWLFASGFSTRDETTELSGRGVGLDVVDRTVRALGGTVRVESELGSGTRFMLQVPISTAVADLLYVEFADSVFAIPLRRIIETGRLRREDVERLVGVTRLRWRDELIAIAHLEPFFMAPAVMELDALEEFEYMVILEMASGAVCLPVRRFRGKGQAVLHSLGDELLKSGPFSGATVLGDGRVSYIIDPDRLFGYVQRMRGGI